MANTIKTSKRSIPIFRIIMNHLFIIILIIVIGVVGGFMYGKYYKKTTYTATSTVQLTTQITETTSTSTDVAFAKTVLSTVASIIKMPKAVVLMNQNYTDREKSGLISSGSIGLSTTESSLIFNISYTDSSIETAKDKLVSVIIGAREILQEQKDLQNKELILAGTVDIVSTGASTTSVNSNVMKYTILFGVIGVGVSIILVVLLYLINDKVKSKDELEEIVGASVLATISEKEY